MKDYLKYGALVLIGMMATGTVSAQEPGDGPAGPEPIGLDEVTEQALANNHEMRSAALAVSASRADEIGAKAFFLPQLEASVTGSVSNLPLNAFGSKLNQGIIEQSDFIPADLNNPSATTNLQSRFLVRQPIMNLDGRAMKHALESTTAAYALKEARTRQQMHYEAARAYLQLQLAYEVVDVLDKALETANASLQLTKDMVDVGYAQKADALYAELRILEIENQLSEADNNIRNASDQLSLLIGRELGTVYRPSTDLEAGREAEAEGLLADPLPLGRSDIQAMEKQVEAQQHMLASAKKSFVPRLNAFGSYEVNNPMDFADAQHGYAVAIQASWSLFNGNRNRSAIQKAEVNLDAYSTSLEQYVAQNELQLQVARRTMLNALNRIALAEKAIEQSEEILRIKTDRYEQGLEKTTDVLLAETDVAQKEMDYVEALFNFHLAYADILLLLERETE